MLLLKGAKFLIAILLIASVVTDGTAEEIDFQYSESTVEKPREITSKAFEEDTTTDDDTTTTPSTPLPSIPPSVTEIEDDTTTDEDTPTPPSTPLPPTVDQEIKELKLEVVKLNSEVNGLKQEVLKLNSKANGLEKDVGKLTNEVNEYKVEIIKLSSKVDWLQSQLAIPGVVWFLLAMVIVLTVAVLFIFYRGCSGRGNLD